MMSEYLTAGAIKSPAKRHQPRIRLCSLTEKTLLVLSTLSLLILAFVLLTTTTPVQAHNISADIFVANNYIFRGLTKTKDQATVQGGVYYYHDIGIDIGLRISNVDFRPGAGRQGASLYEDNENIYTAGYTFHIKDASIRLGATNYEYPSGGGPRFHEFNGDIGYKGFGLSLNYDPEHENLYSSISYEREINDRMSWMARIGHYNLNDPDALTFKPVNNFESYSDILLGFHYEMDNAFTWGIEYSRTDLDTSNTDEYGRFIISLNKRFELWSSKK